MEAKLMYGDFVKYEGNILEVIGISLDNIRLKNEEEEEYDINIKDLDPIPLTQEILDKNSISVYHKTESIVYYGMGNDNVEFIIFADTALDKFTQDGIMLKWVHQLQHIFDLRGVNKVVLL